MINIILKKISLLSIIFSINTATYAQILFKNSDFEQGVLDSCSCPDGYNCFNDAGFVINNFHPLYSPGSRGCAGNNPQAITSYANSLGAHSGKGYVYFYAGSDFIQTKDTNFVGCEQIKLCVWYAGPQGTGAEEQNTEDAHFSFRVDGLQSSIDGLQYYPDDILVPVNTKWTKFCSTITVTTGKHNFSIHTGNPARFSMWFDDFTVEKVGTLPCPKVDLGKDTTLCNGELLKLNVANKNASIRWQNNSSNDIFTVTKTGKYWVEVNNNCCNVTDTINVNYNPIPIINLGNDTILCEGDSLQLDVTTLGATYQWQDNSTNFAYNVKKQGEYSVKVTKNNCSKTDTVNINFYKSPTINLGNDTLLCEGEILKLDASTMGASYQWQDGSLNSIYTIKDSGKYYVTVKNKCGLGADTICLKIKDCTCFVDIPDAFSPNADGFNDILYVRGNCVEDLTFMIFDRWGEKVFETKDINNGWDGTFKDEKMESAVFVYYIEAISSRDGNKITKKGNVSLIR